MNGITFDLGHVPSVLAALRNPGNVQRVANAMAESYDTDTRDWIQAGRGFTPRHGGAGLEGSIGWHPNGNGSATVYANKNYARYVEEGTGIHAGHDSWVIHPRVGRNGLRTSVSGGGGYVIGGAREHQGSKPHPFFFADPATRSEHMQAAGLSVLARVIANG